jgi:gluconolactonase
MLHSQNCNAQKSKSIIAKNAQLVKLYDQCIFTEGPASDKNGNVYFTDQPNNRIMKWSTDGEISVFMENSGRSNGLYFDKDGNLLSCADEKNQLWKIDMQKQVTVLLSSFEGKKFNGPNDLWIDPKGGIYFTDPYYKRDYWANKNQELPKENLYYLAPDQKSVVIADSNFVKPNGLIGSSDGKLLYVADIGDSKTYKFDINADGSLTNRQLFVEHGSDGMTLDNKGNLYLTGKGVLVFDKQGNKIEHIAIDENWTANVTFGGKNGKTLFITAMSALYSLEMDVKGVK